MIRDSTKQTQRLVLTFGRKIAPKTRTGIQRIQPGGLWQNRQGNLPPLSQSVLPGGIIEIEQFRRRGFIDRIQAPLLGEGGFACIILICDGVPAGQTRRRRLIVQNDRGIGQIVKQRVHLIVKERQPMLYALMFSPG